MRKMKHDEHVLLQKYKSSKSWQPVLLRVLEQCSLYNHSPLRRCGSSVCNRCPIDALRYRSYAREGEKS